MCIYVGHAYVYTSVPVPIQATQYRSQVIASQNLELPDECHGEHGIAIRRSSLPAKQQNYLSYMKLPCNCHRTSRLLAMP
jgi:hypothetical protein